MPITHISKKTRALPTLVFLGSRFKIAAKKFSCIFEFSEHFGSVPGSIPLFSCCCCISYYFLILSCRLAEKKISTIFRVPSPKKYNITQVSYYAYTLVLSSIGSIISEIFCEISKSRSNFNIETIFFE